MALTDIRGVPVSTRNRTALDRYETAAELFHGYFGDPVAEIDQALADDPHFVMGHCLRAGLMISAGDKAVEPMLRASVEAAEALAGIANERERGHIAAARAWLDGDFARANALYGRVVVDYPRDALALQLAHLCDFYLGQSTMLRDRVAQVLPHWSAEVPGYGYVLGMYAFGLEETAHYAAAEDHGRRALDANRRDPWAVHAVAHVMEMQGRQGEGVRWLTERQSDWCEDNALAIHNWWHLALFRLEQGEVDAVLDLYDRRVRAKRSDIMLDLIDASALLWRLHLRGVDLGTRWRELAEMWEPRAEDGHYAFNDAHAMMAFVGAGREDAAQRLLAAQAGAAAGGTTNAAMTRDVGLPLCRALDAFGREDYATAIEDLEPVRLVAQRLGGSHAQRDIVHLTLVEAALRSGQTRLAQALVAERCAQKPASRHNLQLAKRARREREGDAVAATVAGAGA